jgi:hypothetical protein
LILDTRSKLMALDSERDPMRFSSLNEALAEATELRGSGARESFAILDDLGNRWLWSKTGVLRVALTSDVKYKIEGAIKVDQARFSFILQTRCRSDGVVETSHYVRLPRRTADPAHDRRNSETASWVEWGTLTSFIGSVPTRPHRLEQRALNEKARAGDCRRLGSERMEGRSALFLSVGDQIVLCADPFLPVETLEAAHREVPAGYLLEMVHKRVVHRCAAERADHRQGLGGDLLADHDAETRGDLSNELQNDRRAFLDHAAFSDETGRLCDCLGKHAADGEVSALGGVLRSGSSAQCEHLDAR